MNSLAWLASTTTTRSGVLTPEQFGATGNGTADDTAALTAALAALLPGDTLWISSGRAYTHAEMLEVTADGVTITGGGEIRATDEFDSAFVLSGDHIVVDDVTFTCPTTTVRSEAFEHQKLILNQCTGARLRKVIIDGSASSGIFCYGASEYHIDGCTVRNTRADSFHNVKGSNYGLFTDCLAENGGDDGFACISYATGGDAGTTHHIRVHNCRVVDTQARGLSAVGGYNFEFVGCAVDGSRGAALIAATEFAFSSPDTERVTFRDIEIRRANTVGTSIPDHGAILIDAARSGTVVDDVVVRNVRTVGTRTAASREIAVNESGGGACSNIVLDNVKVDGTGPATTFSATSPATAYQLYEVGQIHRGGWEMLGQTLLTSAAATTGAITAAARDELMVIVRVAGMSAADIPALRFNGDTGNNYVSRHLTAAAGGATLVDVPQVSTDRMRLSGVSVNGSREHEVIISNHGSWEKAAILRTATAPGSAATAPALDVAGSGGWINSAAQITSVTLLTTGGATLNAGSGFLVFGRNLG